MRAVGWLVVLLGGLILCPFWLFPGVEPDEEAFPIRGLFGHNGLGDLFPEDSAAVLCFLKHCRKDWCHSDDNQLSGVEFDVQLSRDGELILHHDEKLASGVLSNDQMQSLGDYKADQIAQFDIRSHFCHHNVSLSEPLNEIHRHLCQDGAPCASQLFISTLRQAILSLSDLNMPLQLAIEIKPTITNSSMAIEKIKELFREFPELYKSAFVISFVPQVLVEMKRQEPSIRTGWIILPTLLESICKSGLLKEQSLWGQIALCDLPYVTSMVDFFLSYLQEFIAPRLGLDFICPHFSSLPGDPISNAGIIAQEIRRWKSILSPSSRVHSVYFWGVSLDDLPAPWRKAYLEILSAEGVAFTTKTWPISTD